MIYSIYSFYSYSKLKNQVSLAVLSKCEENYHQFQVAEYKLMGIDYNGEIRVREWEQAKDKVMFDLSGNFATINGDSSQVLGTCYSHIIKHS